VAQRRSALGQKARLQSRPRPDESYNAAHGEMMLNNGSLNLLAFSELTALL
jgi:hypothetical protein